MKKRLLISAISVLISASANARETILLCTHQGGAGPGFNVRVNFENSVLMFYYQGSPTRYRATITPDYIEYGAESSVTTRIDRISGDYVSFNSAGKRIGIGSCKKVDGPVID